MGSLLPERIHTRFTELVNVRYPVIQGGLSHLSYAELAAAVSNAGGLGQIGCACFSTPEELQADIQKAKRLTKQPFGGKFSDRAYSPGGFCRCGLSRGTSGNYYHRRKS